MAPLTNCDHFDRADGGLGSNWDSVPFIWQEVPNALVIISGAAEDGRSSGSHKYAAARYTIEQPGNQAIEAEITRLWEPSPADVGTGHYAFLLANMTTGDQSLRMLEIITDVNLPDNVYLNIVQFDADGNTFPGSQDDVVTITSLADTIRVRFESDTDKTCRAYVDDVLQLTFVCDEVSSGTYCGFGTSSGDHFGTIPAFIESVRFNEVCFPGTVTGWRVGTVGWGTSPW